MQAALTQLGNKPGSWAEVADKIAQRGVNILGFGLATNGSGYVGLVGSDEMATKVTGTYRDQWPKALAGAAHR